MNQFYFFFGLFMVINSVHSGLNENETFIMLNSGSGEMQNNLEAVPSSQDTQMVQLTTEEVELDRPTTAETTPSAAEGITPSAAGGITPSATGGITRSATGGITPSATGGITPSATGGITPSAATETFPYTTAETGSTTTAAPGLVHAPYDCSATSRSQKARAIASFKMGLSLIVELNGRIMQSLVQVPTFCPQTILSILNVAGHPNINRVQGLQGVANSIGKMNAYLRLIQQSQVESYHADMQALHDVLSGTILDLYKVLSPTYCANCSTPAAAGTNSSDCFTVPQLSINYFTEDCSLIRYICATISYEMLFVNFLSSSWLQSQDVRPLPEITELEWLTSHVSKSSPAIAKLT